ncbi:Lar family restriction alleviation protein [Balneolales bacterium ANBcel1]|nr:Lar family restriction alleviation protein [Balneolales bacterium ANBcel1]
MEWNGSSVTEEVEVKQCPFCGSEQAMAAELVGVYWVQCQECYASTSLEDNMETALDKWNSRS